MVHKVTLYNLVEVRGRAKWVKSKEFPFKLALHAAAKFREILKVWTDMSNATQDLSPFRIVLRIDNEKRAEMFIY